MYSIFFLVDIVVRNQLRVSNWRAGDSNVEGQIISTSRYEYKIFGVNTTYFV